MARLRDQSVKHDPLAGLSAQERRILELIGEGLTNRQIGERMFLAEKTVKNYVSALFAKLGMERRTQAAAYAVRVFGDHHDGDGEHHLGSRVPASRDLSPWIPGPRPGILAAMYSDGSALTQLPRAECLKLMASVPMGRVIYTRRALPAVELVTFAFAGGEIVLRTDPGGQLAVARGAVVAFEVDWLDLDHRSAGA